jgi:hypothetical protein
VGAHSSHDHGETNKGGVMELFGETFVPGGLRGVLAGTQRCPRCVWPYLHRVASLDQEHWLCSSCGHCFYLDHGKLRGVDSVTCHGCADRDKDDCITLLQHEFPHFGPGPAGDEELTYA